MSLVQNGTPFVGIASLSPSALGPVVFTLYTVLTGASAYTLQAAAPAAGGFTTGTSGTPTAERCFITNIAVSSNDSAGGLVTIDAGSGTPAVASAYVAAGVPFVQLVPRGVLRLVPGVPPRITASAIASGKAVAATILGFISRS